MSGVCVECHQVRTLRFDPRRPVTDQAAPSVCDDCRCVLDQALARLQEAAQ